MCSMETTENETRTETITKKKKTKRDKSTVLDKEDEMLGLMPRNVSFTIEEGVRILSPYWATYRTRTKGRWVGRKMVEVFSKEFLSTNEHYAAVACKMGRIRVNGAQMTDVDYVLRDNDSIVHISHRHEPRVYLDRPVHILADTPQFLVVNKPAGIPVHPCGQYRIHTVLGLLETVEQIRGLRVLHRLDCNTSGVLIFAKDYDTDRKFKKLFDGDQLHKEYICMVEGVFPGEAETIIEEPIATVVPSMGIQWVNKVDGKSARTRCSRLWTDGEKSIVRCVLDTGRTHQIRVHLQYLGHPIVGDRMYNSYVWGVEKGKNGEYGKSYDQLCSDLRNEHRASLWHEVVDQDYEKRMAQMSIDPEISPEDFDQPRPDYDRICLGCHVIKKSPTMEHSRMFLHCLRYQTQDWSFDAPYPEWAHNLIVQSDKK